MSKENICCHFGLPADDSRLRSNLLRRSEFLSDDKQVLVFAVYCNMGNSQRGNLSLSELKGYIETSEFNDYIPDLSRAQSHYQEDDATSDDPPGMIRYSSAQESTKATSNFHSMDIPLKDVTLQRISSHCYNFFIALHPSYFDISSELHGSFVWSAEEDTVKHTYHFSLELGANNLLGSEKFASISFGTIAALGTDLVSIIEGLINCIHPLIGEVIKPTSSRRDECYSNFSWVFNALLAFLQSKSSLFHGIHQEAVLNGLKRHLVNLPKGKPNHAPCFVSSIGLITSVLSKRTYEQVNLEEIYDMVSCFFDEKNRVLLDRLSSASNDSDKEIFLRPDGFFDYFCSLRRGLLFLLEEDTKGCRSGMESFSRYWALGSVVPLLQRTRLAKIQVERLYCSEIKGMIKENIRQVEITLKGLNTHINEDMSKKHFSSSEARLLAGAIRGIAFNLSDVDRIYSSVEFEVIKMYDYLSKSNASGFNPNDLSSKFSSINLYLENLRADCIDFCHFYDWYVEQSISKSTMFNFWNLSQYESGEKFLLESESNCNCLLLPWVSGRPQCLSTVTFAMKQPLGLAFSRSLSTPILYASGLDSSLSVFRIVDARSVIANGPGSMMGDLQSSQLRVAKSLCSFSLQLPNKNLVHLLVIADTGNNCLKALVDDEACNDSDVSDNPHFPNKSLFALANITNPTSVCILHDDLVVSSAKENALFRVTFDINKKKNIISDKVLAGKVGQKGETDGPATTSALLSSPTFLASNDSMVFFAEVRSGNRPAIRSYDSKSCEIKTLHKGDPIKTISGLCCASQDLVYVSDRSNNCIWSLSVSSGHICKKIEASDVSKLILPVSFNKNMDFCPGEIAKAGDGSFVVFDSSSGTLFRILERSVVEKSVQASSTQLFQLCKDRTKKFCDSVFKSLDGINKEIHEAKELSGRLFHLQTSIMSDFYCTEVEKLKRLHFNHRAVQPETLIGMISNAPSVVALHRMLTSITVEPNFQHAVRLAVVNFFKSYDFSTELFIDVSEYTAVRDIFLHSNGLISGEEVMCTILKNEQFRFAVKSPALTMLGGLLRRLNWTMNRQEIPDLRRDVVRWLSRCLPHKAALGWTENSHEEVLLGALEYWTCVFHELTNEIEDVKKALHWVVRIHLDSLCMGFVRSSLPTSILDQNYDLYHVDSILPVPAATSASDKTIADNPTKNMDRTLLTLRSLPYIFDPNNKMMFKMPFDLLSILGDVAADVSRTLQISVAIEALLQSSATWEQLCSTLPQDVSPPSVSIEGKRVCPFSFVVQFVMLDALKKYISILESRVVEKMTTQYNKLKDNVKVRLEYLMEAENKVKNPPNWEYQIGVVALEPYLWSHFLHWRHAEIFSRSRSSTLWTNELNQIGKRLEVIFFELGINACRGHVTIDTLHKICSHGRILQPGFAAVASMMGDERFIRKLDLEFQNALSDVEVLSKVLSVISPSNCSHLSTAYTLFNSWHSITLNSIRKVLWYQLPADCDEYSDSFVEYYGENTERIRAFDPLPRVVVQMLPWISSCMEKTELFAHVWQLRNEGESISDAVAIDMSEAWHHLAHSLLDQSITCASLEKTYNFLSTPLELMTLLRTGIEVPSAGNGWQVLDNEHVDVSRKYSSVQNNLKVWNKIKRLYETGSQKVINDVLDLSQHFLDLSAVSELEEYKSTYACLCTSLDCKGHWGDLTLQEVLTLSSAAASLDEGILNVSTKLLSHLADNDKLVIFLRTLSSDKAFSSALDVALGLTEMECPSEIWDLETNRVNEKFISMLRNVRSYLHAYLYEWPLKFKSFQSFVSVFGQLNPSMNPEVMAENIAECGLVRNALADVINFTTEGASNNRLMKIFEPSLNAHWLCSSSLDDSTHQVSLAYSEVNRGTGKCVIRRYALNELLDFQSNVVLSKTSDLSRSDCLLEVIDKFLHQLCWMRRLRECLLNLFKVGHFDYYPSYEMTFPVHLDDSVFVAAVHKAEQQQTTWQDRINCIREKHYFMNFFEMKRVCSLSKVLQSSSAADQNALSSSLFDFFCFVNIDMANDKSFIASKSREAIEIWNNSFMSSSKIHLSDRVEDVCAALDAFCADMSARIRLARFDEDLSQHSTLPNLRYGCIYTSTAPSSYMEYKQVLSAFGLLGIFPEWETCLMCSPHTTAEQVCNFLRRWHGSRQYRHANRLYYLLGAHNLSYAIQDMAILLLRDFDGAHNDSEKPCPLIMSCLSGKYQCPLISQFKHNSLSIQSLPSDIISQMFSNLESCARVFHSTSPGAGKSFNVRTKAAADDLCYEYIPVNNAVLDVGACSSLLNRLLAGSSHYLSTGDKYSGVLFHFDLSNSIDAQLGLLLFQICVLGVVQDFTGAQVFSCSSKTSISVELACGLIEGKLKLFDVFPSSQAVANRANFVFNEAALRIGMGIDFDCSLYDGTMNCKSQANREVSNAYRRLRYVGIALSVLQMSHGTFPYNFDPSLGDSESNNNHVNEKECQIDMAKDTNKISHVKNDDESIALSGGFLDAQCLFDILFFAIGKKYHDTDCHEFRQNDYMNLWGLWNFVNVLYWQLQEMHHVESPLNGACMPDPNHPLKSISDDVRSKRKIKGEIIKFMVRTAREFAIRQSSASQIKEKQIISATVSGLSRDMFNKNWVRTYFDNDGKPCFMLNRGEFYLYYRANSDCWVIDDIIESSGATYCYSKSGNANSAWTVSPTWDVVRSISSTCITNLKSKAYRNECVQISGCGTVAANSSCSATEDGVYERQPPYDDINKYPHYIKDWNDPSKRRHLFYSSSRFWVVAPQCNEDQGYFIRTTSFSSLSSAVWEAVPCDKVESGIQVTFNYSDEEQNKSVVTEVNAYDLQLLRWQDSNHECILFNNAAHTVAFLSSAPGKLISQLHPALVSHLNENHINIEGGTGEGLRADTTKCWQLLNDLTNISKTSEERNALLGGSFCLTGDALLKMLAIQYRIQCGIPVVLLGECGCGKTMLLRFLCAWLDVRLISLDVHGGTTEEEIVNTFVKAGKWLGSSTHQTVYVFLDEINTCAHMGLIAEAISHRSINGVRLHNGIRILAALNPYRRKPDNALTTCRSGLVDSSHHQNEEALDSPLSSMRDLVYKVHPIPVTLKDLIFDFGSLSDEVEAMYISRMVKNNAKVSMTTVEEGLISYLISRSQEYMRKREGDPSVVSLRDVQRCIDLLNWFSAHIGSAAGEKQKVSPLCRSTILAIAHVYSYRLPSSTDRYSFWLNISSIVKSYGKDAEKAHFHGLTVHGLPQRIVQNMQRRFVNNLVVDEDVSLNHALTENLFVTIVCLLNKIPIFIVGKPGTSKTLCVQIIASNLQGEQSVKPLWRKFPAVHFFQYQCSPMSTAESINFQFEAAKTYQQHSQDSLTVLLLDEVGLAENSPDMPLKVLHYMLIDPPIAIMGLSNWVLDSSKMNRAVCLQRPDPSKEDIILTGKNIAMDSSCSSSEHSVPSLARARSSNFSDYFTCLANSFHILYTNQRAILGGKEGRDFIGMRDYYSLLKHIKGRGGVEKEKDPQLLVNAVCHNFGGQPMYLSSVVDLFLKECFNSTAEALEVHTPSVLRLIEDNLKSTSSRHLMILSSGDVAMQLMLGYGILPRSGMNVLVGSQFKDDIQELHVLQQINEVKHAMATGRVIALLQNSQMFESLYDVLNQRYVFKQDAETGEYVKMLRLALGPRSQLCPVKDGFKLIVFVDQHKAYDSLDLPLLNRFEKHVLYPSNFLDDLGCEAMKELEMWCLRICQELELNSLEEVFCGYYAGTLSSLIVMLIDFGHISIVRNKDAITNENRHIEISDLVELAKQKLLMISFPTVLLKARFSRLEHSESTEVDKSDPLAKCITSDLSLDGDFSRSRSSLCSTLTSMLFSDCLATIGTTTSNDAMIFLTTKSPLPHFYVIFDRSKACGFADQIRSNDCSLALSCCRTSVLQLALVDSEQKLTDSIRCFYHNEESDAAEILFILCDPMYISHEVICHSRLVCVNERSLFHETFSDSARASLRRNIVFIVHLPPGIQSRQRLYTLDFNAPWHYGFIDDLRSSESIDGISFNDLTSKSSYTIFHDVVKDKFVEIVQNSFQSALAWRLAPDCGDADVGYIKIMHELLANEIFLELMLTYVLRCLELHEYGSHNLFLHLEIASAEYAMIGGSFRDAIWNILEHLVLQAMAHVIRCFDQDFNLLTLYRHHSDRLADWVTLARFFCDASKVARSCHLVKPSEIQTVNKQVFNSGLHGTLVASFPFSHKLFKLMSDPAIKSRVEVLAKSGKGFEDSKTFLNSSIEAIVGKTVYCALKSYCRYCPSGFLHDFVSFAVPSHGISCTKHVRLFKKLMEILLSSLGLPCEDENFAPASVLAFYWGNENLLNVMMTAISSSLEHKELIVGSMESLDQFLEELLSDQVYVDSKQMSIDLLIPSGLIKYLWQGLVSGFDMGDFSASSRSIKNWVHFVRKVFSDVEVLVWQYFSSLSREEMSSLVDSLYQEHVNCVSAANRVVQHIQLLNAWWSLSYAVIIANELIESLSFQQQHETMVHRFHRLCQMLRDKPVFSPFSRLNHANVLQTFCEGSDMCAASMLKKIINGFVVSERDVLAKSVVGRVLVIPCGLIKSIHEFLLSSYHEQDSLSKKEKGNNTLDDELKSGNRSHSIDVEVLRLHQSFVRILIVESANAVKCLRHDAFEEDALRSKSALSCLSSIFQLDEEFNQKDALRFFEVTIQLAIRLQCSLRGADIEEDNSSDAIDDVMKLNEVEARNSLLKFSEAPIHILASVAVLRGQLTAISLEMANQDFQLSHNEKTIRQPIIKFINQCSMANTFVLKIMRRVGGNDKLMDYLKQKCPEIDFPLGAKRLVSNNEDCNMINPFLLLQGKEHFTGVVDSLISSASIDSFEEWRGKTSSLSNIQLLGLVLSVFYVKAESSMVDINLFRVVVQRLSESSETKRLGLGVLDWMSGFQTSSNRSSSKLSRYVEQLKVHLVIMAIENPDSFFYYILTNPATLKTSFIPSMPRSEMEEVMLTYGNSVGWYACPNGHIYTVGNCTYPMQETRCTAEGCNALIGGHNHSSSANNKRISTTDAVFQGTPGYHTSILQRKKKENLCLSDRIMRLMIHGVMVASIEIGHANIPGGNIAMAMSNVRTKAYYIDDMRSAFSHDLNLIKTTLGFAADDTCLALHMTLLKWNQFQFASNDGLLQSNMKRVNYEHDFETVCNSITGGSDALAFLHEIKQSLSVFDNTSMLIDALGKSNWLHISENSSVLTSPKDCLLQYLWQMQDQVTYEAFVRYFRMNSTLATKHPVLHVIVENESSLELVKYIGDILAWHNFLFMNVPPDMTREKASTVKNIDFINELPRHAQAKGKQLLDAFCDAFNASFHLVEFLYECNPNPFLTAEGDIDLTGSQGKCSNSSGLMGAETTLNFSLPSISHGETDATGLCTVKLLSHLEGVHNGVMATLQKARCKSRIEKRDAAMLGEKKSEVGPRQRILKPGVTPELREALEQTRTQQSQRDEDMSKILQPAAAVPTTHHGTPSEIVSKRLLHYSRETTLLPLLQEAVHQSLEFGSGGRIKGFDLCLIEEELTEQLLATSSPLALKCAQFCYAGEVRNSGGLRKLGAKVSQQVLSDSLVTKILTEIDTQSRLVKLLQVLEDCISLVAQMPVGMLGSETVDNSGILIEEYVLNTLLLKPSKWDEIKCPTIAQHVRLTHLQSLYLALENRKEALTTGRGDPLKNVSLKYREAIEGDMLNTLQNAISFGHIDRNVFIPLLREFACEQLCTAGWPSNANLKEYMGYSTELDLDSMSWFVDPNVLPEELELKHAYALYHMFFKE